MSFKHKKKEKPVKILISLCVFNRMEHFGEDVRNCIQ